MPELVVPVATITVGYPDECPAQPDRLPLSGIIHEEEILLHQAAKNAFDEMGVKKLPKVKDLQAEYAKLLEEKKKTYAEYRRSREEMRELLTAKANVDRLLKMDEEQKKEQEKDHGQR